MQKNRPSSWKTLVCCNGSQQQPSWGALALFAWDEARVRWSRTCSLPSLIRPLELVPHFLFYCEGSLHRAPAKHFTGSVSAYIDDALSKGISQVSSPCST